MILRTITVTALTLSLVAAPSAASAASQHAAGQAAPRSHFTPDEETDLKTDCRHHDAEAGSQRGWPRSRFEQCHHYKRRVLLLHEDITQIGYVDYDLWILAFAYDGSRRVDYVTSVEGIKPSEGMNPELTYITLSYNGCAGRGDVVCNGPTTEVENVPVWNQLPNMPVIVIQSPQGSGTGPHDITNYGAQLDVLVDYRDGNTVPSAEVAIAYNAVRFDSAKASLGNGKFLGTVFTDFVPTLVLPLNGAGIDQEARHVDDALHHPERTFPSFLGKYVPGQQGHPLHRLMDTTQKDSNHAAAVSICVDVWGIDYATGGLECDEYPFKTTREGAYVSTQGNPGTWNGSARPISARDNGTGGVLLGNFYGSNRLLDNDAFFVTTQ